MTALQNIFIGLLRYLKDYCSDLQPTKFPIPFFASQTRDYFDFQRIGGIFNHLQQTEPVNLSDYDINNFNYDARFHGELFEYLLLLTHLGVGHKLRQVGDRVNIIREVDRENIKPNHVSTINVLPFSPLLPSIFFLLPCPSSPSLLPFPPLLPSLLSPFFSLALLLLINMLLDFDLIFIILKQANRRVWCWDKIFWMRDWQLENIWRATSYLASIIHLVATKYTIFK